MPVDYEIEYNNGRRVPEYPQFVERWTAASAAYRARAAAARADLDVAYGAGERQRYDFFPAGDNAPLAVYIHGGYWQRGDRKLYAFVAQGLNAAGVSVAIPSYALCPDGTVMDCVADLRRLLAALWQRTGRRAVVAGHSAGGHLAAAMLATDWGQVSGVPRDLVRAGHSISGVFDLVPLVGTSINDALGLDVAAARAASPQFWPAPAGGTFVAMVGGAESSEFLRQSRDMAAQWARAGIATEFVPVAGANHFTVIDPLIDPAAPITRRLAELARGCV